jgi:hypothetical protein
VLSFYLLKEFLDGRLVGDAEGIGDNLDVWVSGLDQCLGFVEAFLAAGHEVKSSRSSFGKRHCDSLVICCQ